MLQSVKVGEFGKGKLGNSREGAHQALNIVATKRCARLSASEVCVFWARACCCIIKTQQQQQHPTPHTYRIFLKSDEHIHAHASELIFRRRLNAVDFKHTDTERGMPPGIPGGAICVQRFDDSLSFAIRITYRISLRSSSYWEPRHPSLKGVMVELIYGSSALADISSLFQIDRFQG